MNFYTKSLYIFNIAVYTVLILECRDRKTVPKLWNECTSVAFTFQIVYCFFFRWNLFFHLAVTFVLPSSPLEDGRLGQNRLKKKRANRKTLMIS